MILIPVVQIRVQELDVVQMRVVLKGLVLVIPVIPEILTPVVPCLVQVLLATVLSILKILNFVKHMLMVVSIIDFVIQVHISVFGMMGINKM